MDFSTTFFARGKKKLVTHVYFLQKAVRSREPLPTGQTTRQEAAPPVARRSILLCMYYYEVLVGDLKYHGSSALTYASEEKLAAGLVVRIALRNRSVLGVVLQEVREPSFAAKPIAAIAPTPALPAQTLELIDWLYSYYPAPFGAVIRQFLPPSTAFPKNQERPQSPPSSASYPTSSTLPPLTAAQKVALQKIQPSGYHLLHGITGSGKTRMYLELARQTIQAGKSAILLTPEIGLTAQLTTPFEQQFPGSVFVLHSRLTAAQRRDIWYKILAAPHPIVVIGPRSALFAPVHRLGLVVIDESHDQAYKSETAPHYRTERVAAKLAKLHGARLISGSATPSLEEYYLAHAKNRPIVQLDSLAVQSDTTAHTHIIDVRDRSQLTRSPILSTPLIEAIQRALTTGEQSLLFLNRRGTAGSVLCTTCGWQAVCSHCDLNLTYHGDIHRMRCHVCGRAWPLPGSCPECGAADIVLKSMGTKAVVDEVKRLFPQARLARFDTDTEKAEQIETQFVALQTGQVDIIIGTQMVTKGLDLPLLSVVGVLNADTSLLVPDYTAGERTYQLLTQVIGRAARGHRAGAVYVQTYSPKHPIITAATTKDWSGFYAQEIAERQSYRFPPFVYTLKLTCLRATSQSAEDAATKLKQQIEKTHLRLKVEGPSPAFHPRESGKYKWHFIVKSASRQPLVDVVSSLPSGWSSDLDPINLL